MRKYNLEITEKQAKIIIQSLDFFSRMGCGQWNEIFYHPSIGFSKEPNINEIARNNINFTKNLIMGLGKNEFIGIFESDECNKIAWDILQVIRHRIAWDNEPRGGIQVIFDTPFKSSKQEKLSKIKLIEDE